MIKYTKRAELNVKRVFFYNNIHVFALCSIIINFLNLSLDVIDF